MNYELFIRVVLGLGASILLLRKTRDYIRKRVLKQLPVETRFSEDSFRIQNRNATIISLILLLLLSALFSWSSGQVWKRIRAANSTLEDPAVITDLVTQPRKRDDYPNVEPVTPKNDAPDSILEDQASNPELTPEPVQVPKRKSWYLQIQAIADWDFLDRELKKVRIQHHIPVLYKEVANERYPIKILIGPFTSKQAAAAYKQKYAPNDWWIRKFTD